MKNTIYRVLWCIGCVLVLSVGHAHALQLLDTQPLLTSMYAIYSPADDLYVAGWKTVVDQQACTMMSGGEVVGNPNQPCDRIYKAENGNLIQNFALLGKAVNDPTFVRPPSVDGVDRSQWLFMYYTVIDHVHYFPCEEGMDDCTRYNEVGFASSVDGGLTWANHGVILGLANGLVYNNEGCGAWSPSALVVDNQIWLYYHLNSQCISLAFTDPVQFIGLTKLNANGWQIIEQHFVETPMFVVNIDVQQRPNGLFLMVGNTGEQNALIALESGDGESFIEHHETLDGRIIIAAPGVFTITPALSAVTNSSWSLTFSYGEVGVMNTSSVHRWKFQEE